MRNVFLLGILLGLTAADEILSSIGTTPEAHVSETDDILHGAAVKSVNVASNSIPSNGALKAGLRGLASEDISEILTDNEINNKAQISNTVRNRNYVYGSRGAELALLEGAVIPGVGVAGVDYPVLSKVPETGFVCEDTGYSYGYFADTAPETGCQVFHICQTRPNGYQRDSFLCPNGTIFNQQYLVCDWWFNADCSQATSFYSVNEFIGQYPSGVESVLSSVYGARTPSEDKNVISIAQNDNNQNRNLYGSNDDKQSVSGKQAKSNRKISSNGNDHITNGVVYGSAFNYDDHAANEREISDSREIIGIGLPINGSGYSPHTSENAAIGNGENGNNVIEGDEGNAYIISDIKINEDDLASFDLGNDVISYVTDNGEISGSRPNSHVNESNTSRNGVSFNSNSSDSNYGSNDEIIYESVSEISNPIEQSSGRESSSSEKGKGQDGSTSGNFLARQGSISDATTPSNVYGVAA